MKKTLFLIITILSILMISCNQKIDNTEEPITDNTLQEDNLTYGIVYNDYIGIVNMQVVDDIITYITLDEAFMPISWARETKTGVLTDVVTYNDGTPLKYSNEFSYAKYIKIDNEVFIGIPYTDEELKDSNASKQLIKYSSNNIPDLYEYLKEEKHAAWYVEALKKGKVYICDKNGNNLNINEYNPYGSFFKSSSLYWLNGSSGWSKNIQLFCNALVGTSLNEEIKLEDGYIVIGNITTSATLQGYLDYYNLVKQAYNKLK